MTDKYVMSEQQEEELLKNFYDITHSLTKFQVYIRVTMKEIEKSEKKIVNIISKLGGKNE